MILTPWFHTFNLWPAAKLTSLNPNPSPSLASLLRCKLIHHFCCQLIDNPPQPPNIHQHPHSIPLLFPLLFSMPYLLEFIQYIFKLSTLTPKLNSSVFQHHFHRNFSCLIPGFHPICLQAFLKMYIILHF